MIRFVQKYVHSDIAMTHNGHMDTGLLYFGADLHRLTASSMLLYFSASLCQGQAYSSLSIIPAFRTSCPTSSSTILIAFPPHYAPQMHPDRPPTWTCFICTEGLKNQEYYKVHLNECLKRWSVEERELRQAQKRKQDRVRRLQMEFSQSSDPDITPKKRKMG